MARKKVSTQELHRMLEAEFHKTAAGLCGKCHVPRPVFYPAARGGPNWRLAHGDECPALCHTVMQDLAARFAQQYDLQA